MHDYDLILTLTGGLAAALLLGYTTQRVGLSPIVGYLLAGTLVGPYTPGFVADASLAEQLAEIGVILLMFARNTATIAIARNGRHYPSRKAKKGDRPCGPLRNGVQWSRTGT